MTLPANPLPIHKVPHWKPSLCYNAPRICEFCGEPRVGFFKIIVKQLDKWPRRAEVCEYCFDTERPDESGVERNPERVATRQLSVAEQFAALTKSE